DDPRVRRPIPPCILSAPGASLTWLFQGPVRASYLYYGADFARRNDFKDYPWLQLSILAANSICSVWGTTGGQLGSVIFGGYDDFVSEEVGEQHAHDGRRR